MFVLLGKGLTMEKAILDFYYDWRNNWLTIEAMASGYGLPVSLCAGLIEHGRFLCELNDARIEREASNA